MCLLSSQFCIILQKEVKDGSNVLNTSADSMTDKIEKASDNITNTSAANSSEIVGQIQGISEAMGENNKVTEQLSSSTKRFANL